MIAYIKKCSKRLLPVVAVLVVSTVSCGDKKSQSERPVFTEDESYLIEAYTRIAEARRYYPDQSELADSLFTHLSATIDTTRVQATIDALNQNPERWSDIYSEIERLLQNPSDRSPSRTDPAPTQSSG